MNLQQVMDHALQGLKNTGAQQYSCQAQESQKREFNVDGGLFSLLRTTLDRSLSLTLILDGRRGKVAVNDFTPQSVDGAVQDCLAAAQSAQPDEAWQMDAGAQRSFVLGVPEGDMDGLFHRTKELLSDIKRDYPKVMLEQMYVSHTRAQALYQNSLGARYDTLEGAYSASLMFSAHEEGKTSSFNGGGFTTTSLDQPLIELSSLRQTLADAQNQIHTVSPEGKYTGTVVFTPDCAGGYILPDLLGNYVADGALLEGTSPWKNRLGEQVVDKGLTIAFNPHAEEIVCGERYTADGRLSRDYAVIENGVLKQFMLGDYAARKLGRTPAPNSSGSMMVKPGTRKLQDIIAGIDRGLLVSRFSGGQPSSSGEFSGVAKNSFLIEKGKVTQAVAETMISGNLGDMLNHVRGISQETVRDGNSVVPWIAVDGIVISGK